MSLSIFTILELPFLHHSHPDSTPGVTCGSLPGGWQRLRYDLRGLQRLLRLPRGAAEHGKRRGTTRTAQGDQARLCVAVTWMQRMQRGMVEVDGWMILTSRNVAFTSHDGG